GDFFAHAIGVHVGGVEEVDAGFQRAAEEGTAFVLFQHPVAPFPGAVGHAAETEAGDLEAGRAKPNVVHPSWIPRESRMRHGSRAILAGAGGSYPDARR